MTPSLMMMLAFCLLIGLSGAGLLLSAGFEARRRVSERLLLVAPGFPTLTRPSIGRGRSTRLPAERIAGLFGCNWGQRRHYRFRWWVVLAVAGISGGLGGVGSAELVGPLGLLVIPLLSLLLSWLVFGRWNRQRLDQLQKQLPDALGMLVRTVRVGMPLAEGLRLVGREAEAPTSREFRQAAEEIAIGAHVGDAVRSLAERTGMAEYRFFATVVVLQAQTGGRLSEALDILADVVRRRLALKARGYALTSEARMSAHVLTALPFLIGAAMTALTPDYMGPLFATTTGHELMAGAVVSLLLGILAMQVLIRRTLA